MNDGQVLGFMLLIITIVSLIMYKMFTKDDLEVKS